jgi:hypothetical protein
MSKKNTFLSKKNDCLEDKELSDQEFEDDNLSDNNLDDEELSENESINKFDDEDIQLYNSDEESLAEDESAHRDGATKKEDMLNPPDANSLLNDKRVSQIGQLSKNSSLPINILQSKMQSVSLQKSDKHDKINSRQNSKNMQDNKNIQDGKNKINKKDKPQKQIIFSSDESESDNMEPNLNESDNISNYDDNDENYDSYKNDDESVDLNQSDDENIKESKKTKKSPVEKVKKSTRGRKPKNKSDDTKQRKKKEKSEEKKGPGRPRKNPKKEPIPRKGISKISSNNDEYIGVIYDQPLILKRIFQFFKSLAASQIQIIFRPKEIIFYTEDHHKKSKIRVRIDCSKINHYYCRDVLDIGISSKDMEMILNKADKDYTSVIILSSVGSIHRNITVMLENVMQIDEVHVIDLIGQYNRMENENNFINEDYMIKYKYSTKYFKKTIGDIKSMSTQISIAQEDCESNLVVEYLTSNKKIQSKHIAKNNDKIKLESNLKQGDSFRVDLRIDYIKPISASQIADEVLILVDENKNFMTKSYIDNDTIEIKTLTEIIDERPDLDG